VIAEPMSRAHRAYLIAMCAVIGGAFAYAACDWGHWPHLTYLPLSGKLVMGPTTAIAIHYLGLVAWGTGGACAGAIAGAALCRAVPRPWKRTIFGGPSNAQNIITIRPFSRRWAIVSAPLPV
jgi:hypothetical protein